MRGDFDGDGRAEIPVTGSAGLGLLGWSGGALRAELIAPNGVLAGDWLLDAEKNRFHLVADLDGDGRAEILVSGVKGIAVLARDGPGALGSVMTARDGSAVGGRLLDVVNDGFGPAGDLDGDGRDEVLVVGEAGIAVLALAGPGAPDSLATVPNGARIGPWTLDTARDRFGPVGDLDGDGRAEIVVSGPGGLGVLKLDAGALTCPFMLGPAVLGEVDFPIAAADFAGDGRDEVLLVGAEGLAVLRGGSLLASPHAARVGPVGDFDGDGRAEIVVSGADGIAVLGLSDGGFAPRAEASDGDVLGAWRLDAGRDRCVAAADLAGDGRARVVVAGPAGLGVLECADGGLRAVSATPRGTGLGDWPLDAADRIGIEPEVVRVHVKILAVPDVAIAEMFAAAERVFGTAGLRLHLAGTQTLDLPDLADLDIGGCHSGQLTGEQRALFGHRDGAGPGDLVVYFVRGTVPPMDGCAAHPPGRPGAVVARGAGLWTLGHELGHVLGLRHVDAADRLMTGGGTRSITRPPPDLSPPEAAVLRHRGMP
ncbi:VCBS repeat-containing protein [Actinocorallia sp. A-T 12471]|uniref:FG-GAP repeat domain-containing protein n=1 Tax=Actinocorallia sp. A-T 12471 TaxID=3089813 RepID=UPI0029CE2698|nr:VCBS repeat-containing protein [Actinocorallia sp. A-T 12471]MDX6743832.1 VCBS repeat-containing protein [Actinocorallia sp. A-T 12471]